jgi:hypothetical protein
LILVFVSIGLAQTIPDSGVTPETGYVSDFRYINAFFGFMLPLPHDANFHELPISPGGNPRFVFGLQSMRNGMTVLWVQAKKAGGTSTDEAREAAAGPKGNRTERVEIGGKEFWKAETEMWMFMNGSQSGLAELRSEIRIAFAPSAGGTPEK